MICLVVGTRPEIIKMSPVIRALQKAHVRFELVHSNQHYTALMDTVFFEQLQLPTPNANLHVGSGTHAEQTAKVMVEFEKYCLEKHPSLVVVHGDTNTSLGAALAAKKLQIPVAHVEAGLRSYDQTMPEEVNRILIDHMCDLLFVPTATAKENARNEGIPAKKIITTGNTVVDAVRQHLDLIDEDIAYEHEPLADDGYILVTAHRPSNVDDAKNLTALVKLLATVAKTHRKQLIWPIHPRTRANLLRFKIKVPNSFELWEPVDYFQMLHLMNKAFLIATDSGGIQEEAFVLHKPLITLRENTERPETLTANYLVGLDETKALAAVQKFMRHKTEWSNSLGDGKASIKIVKHITAFLESHP